MSVEMVKGPSTVEKGTGTGMGMLTGKAVLGMGKLAAVVEEEVVGVTGGVVGSGFISRYDPPLR